MWQERGSRTKKLKVFTAPGKPASSPGSQVNTFSCPGSGSCRMHCANTKLLCPQAGVQDVVRH